MQFGRKLFSGILLKHNPFFSLASTADRNVRNAKASGRTHISTKGKSLRMGWSCLETYNDQVYITKHASKKQKKGMSIGVSM